MKELYLVIALFNIFIGFRLTTAFIKTHPLINLGFVGFTYFSLFFPKKTNRKM